jgi:Icc-related predicted phosphoesterase
VTHSPPKGVHDRSDLCHTGFSAFNWMLRAFRPRYLVHGHVHLSGYHGVEEVKTMVGETVVVNAYGHRTIELDGGR